MIPSYYKRQSYAIVNPVGTLDNISSTFITSSVNTHIRAGLFDYVTQPYEGGNRPGNFSSITWTSVGNFSFNTPVGVNTTWSQSFPNAIYSGTNDNHVLYASRALIWPRWFTIMFRFKMDTLLASSALQTLFSSGNINNSGVNIMLSGGTGVATKISIFYSGNGAFNIGPSLSAQTWYHFALCGGWGLTAAARPGLMYIDGLSTTVSAGVPPPHPNFTSTVSLFGGGYTGGDRFLGAMTDFTLINKCLSPEQVNAYYRGGFI